uniref:Uncharacterized protein n=1 Tax=Pseudomonas phage RVTF4 TaxID=3236931 RepID=A0AB39CDD8_9VIRU
MANFLNWLAIVIIVTGPPTLFFVGWLRDYMKTKFRWWVYFWLVMLFTNVILQLGSLFYNGFKTMGVPCS